MKAFYRQRIPEPSCVRKETFDIDILLTSRNDDRVKTAWLAPQNAGKISN